MQQVVEEGPSRIVFLLCGILPIAFMPNPAILWAMGDLMVGIAEAAEGRRPSFWRVVRTFSTCYPQMLTLQLALSPPLFAAVMLLICSVGLAAYNAQNPTRLPVVPLVGCLLIPLFVLSVVFVFVEAVWTRAYRAWVSGGYSV